MIHHTAIVSKLAKIDSTATIGPYAIIEDDVEIAKNVKIYAHAYVCSGTSIDEGTQVHMGAVLGHLPQDQAFGNEKTYLKIGKKNIIREYVTIHRGTKEDSSTRLGNECFLMGHSHVGHNCVLEDKVILVNGALLGGYVTVGGGAFISGNVAIHQFCNIGRLAMIGGFSGVNQDVPPFMIVRGRSLVRSINLVGLRRAGFKKSSINEIREAFKIIYRSGLNTQQALLKISEKNFGEEVKHIVDFIKKSKRGICKSRLNAEEKEEEFYS